MSKPAIPADVLAVAEAHYLDAIVMTAEDEPKAIVRMIARAILAERQRAARVAEEYRSDNPFPTIHGAIARAILNPPSIDPAADGGGATPIGAAATQSDGGGE